jgi:hypothetical protein
MLRERRSRTMNLFEKLRLLAEWSPLLTFAQQLAGEDDMHAKAVIVTEAMEWVASRTEVEWDDELASHISDILVSEEGEAFVRWILERMQVSDVDVAE